MNPENNYETGEKNNKYSNNSKEKSKEEKLKELKERYAKR